MQKLVSKSLEETEKIARNFLKEISENKKEGGAIIVGLFGDLGSGKTSFVKGVAKTLGVEGSVSSPTFVIEKIYKLSDYELETHNFSHLIHIDAYRLSGGEELKNLGWNEIISNYKNIIFIEWPENVEEVLPKEIKKINFKFIDENTREIIY